jgi:hypothetical protein
MRRQNPLSRSGLAIWSLLIGLGAVVIFTLMIAAMSDGRTPASSLAQVTASLPPSVSDTPAPTPPNTPTSATPMPTEEPTPTDVPTPDEQATDNYIATVIAERQIILTTAAYLATTTLSTPVVGPTGIYDNQYVKAYLGKYGFDVENMWFGYVNGHHTNVYAGAPHEDPNQGMLRVYLDLPEGLFKQDYPAPLAAGAVRVVAEQNNRLTLISTDGTTFYFDVPGLQFVDSLTEIVPTITPYVSETPSATWTPGPTQTPVATCTPGPTPTGWPGQFLPPPC